MVSFNTVQCFRHPPGWSLCVPGPGLRRMFSIGVTVLPLLSAAGASQRTMRRRFGARPYGWRRLGRCNPNQLALGLRLTGIGRRR